MKNIRDRNEEVEIIKEKIDWIEEWNKLKSNKIFILFVLILGKIVKKVKGVRDEKNKKGTK